MMLFTSIIASFLVLPSANAGSASVAIMDSGTDPLHPAFANKYQINLNEVEKNKKDDDQNGYIDDRFGYNFADQNGQVIDYQYLNRYSSEIKKFFEVQNKMIRGTATEEDIAWIKSKRDDKDFIADLQVYANFSHGTHVGGISAGASYDSHIFAIKIIPTETKSPTARMRAFFKSFIARKGFRGDGGSTIKKTFFRMFLSSLARKQGDSMKVFGDYVNARNAQVVNCSFGTPFAAAKQIVGAVYENFFSEEERNEEDLEAFAIEFMRGLLAGAKSMIDAAPNALFVMAAGNEGSNNDVYPASPANLSSQSNRVISVAAAIDYSSLASFSNFGATQVDVAAPGVGILSTAPGGNYIHMSGTSQAAPYVTQVAARVFAANPQLDANQVKQIVVGTADAQLWLKGKVRSGGTVNEQRALTASALAKGRAVRDAISLARIQVQAKSFTLNAKRIKALRTLQTLPTTQPLQFIYR